MRYNRGAHHVRLGRLLVDWHANQSIESPWLDGCGVSLYHDDDTPTEHFGGLVLSPPSRRSGVSVAWLGHRVPHPSPRALWRRVRWVLAGRPPGPNYGQVHDGGKVMGGVGPSSGCDMTEWLGEGDQG